MKRSEQKAKLSESTPMGFALATTLLLSSAVSPSGLLRVEAQQVNAGSDQDSSLPPEVVPTDPFSAKGAGNASAMTVPGLVSNPTEATNAPVGEMQSAQDFRKALMDSLSGKGNYPQFNGRNPFANNSGQNNVPFGQSGQPLNQTGNQSFSTAGQPPLGQSDWTAPTQDNSMVNSTPPQTQMLSGPVAAPQTPNRGGNSYAHGLGAGTSAASTVYSGAMSGGSGLYGLGLTGAGLLNYGFQNSLKGF
jgi:hypothetical protein